VATANTSNIQLVHRHFSSEKCVDHLNAANIFNVYTFLQEICKATGLRLQIPKRKVTMNVCSLAFCTNFGWYLLSWYLAMGQIFKELALITIREMWGIESRSRTSRSRSRLLWQSLGLVSKFEPGLGLGGYGLDYIPAYRFVGWISSARCQAKFLTYYCLLVILLLRARE